MHTVELLEQALAAARQMGFDVREEYLGGSGGGSCLLRGRKCLFVDLALTPNEQLDQVLSAITETDDQQVLLQFPLPLRSFLKLRRSA